MTLTPQERAAFQDGCPDMPVPGLGFGDAEQFVRRARNYVWDAAPWQLKAYLQQWKSDPGSINGLLVDNILQERSLPATPTDGKRSSQKLSNCTELILTGTAGVLGDPFAVAVEKPWLVNDLTPVKGKEATATNAGSKKLAWHTEHGATGFWLNQSGVVVSEIILGVLRASPSDDGETMAADVRDAMELLSPSDRAVLQGPYYFLRLPPSLGNAAKFGPRPILFGAEFAFRAIGGLYADGVEATTDAASKALDALRAALDLVQQKVESRPGRVILLNNRMMFHARAPFSPRYDGADRWLQRVLVTQHLEGLQPWLQRSSRIVQLP